MESHRYEWIRATTHLALRTPFLGPGIPLAPAVGARPVRHCPQYPFFQALRPPSLNFLYAKPMSELFHNNHDVCQHSHQRGIQSMGSQGEWDWRPEGNASIKRNTSYLYEASKTLLITMLDNEGRLKASKRQGEDASTTNGMKLHDSGPGRNTNLKPLNKGAVGLDGINYRT